MTLDEYRAKLGWSKAKLASESHVDIRTVRKAIVGEPIFKAKAGEIANAISRGLISRGLGGEVTYKDFEGLKLAD